MKRVARIQIDKNGTAIQPDARWFRASTRRRTEAIRQGANHQVAMLYKSAQVKTSLERLFHDKCAYCESRIGTTAPWDVEHYRPKNKVAEASRHFGGYRWLAYDWDNLFPSCQDCNRRRRDQPRWGEDAEEAISGKHTQFPLKDESKRAYTDTELAHEEPMLLNPCEDDPKEHLAYDPFGNIVKANGSDRGEATIDILGLWRTRLRDDRKRVVEKVVQRLRSGVGQPASERSRIVSGIRKDFAQADDIFLGLVEYIIEHPEQFGCA